MENSEHPLPVEILVNTLQRRNFTQLFESTPKIKFQKCPIIPTEYAIIAL